MKQKHYAWKVMLACCAMMVGIGITNGCCSLYLVPVTTELGVGNAQFAFAITLRSLTTAISAPLVGMMLPRFQLKKLISVMYIIFLVAFASMGAFSSMWQWYIAAVITGFACGFCAATVATNVISNWFFKNTGLVMAVVMACMGIASTVMSPIISGMIQSMGWRMAYVLNAVIAAVIVLPWLLLFLYYSPADKGMEPYGYTADVQTAKTQTAALAGVPGKTARCSMAFWCMFFALAATTICATFVQQFNSYAVSIGMTAMVGAAMVSAQSLGNTGGSFVLGLISDKLNIKTAVMTGASMVLIAFALILFGGASMPVLLVAAFLHGIGGSVTMVGSSLMTRDIFGTKYYNEIYPYLVMAITGIGMLGTTIVGLIYDLAQSFTYAFIFGIAMVILSALLYLLAFVGAKKLKSKWEYD